MKLLHIQISPVIHKQVTMYLQTRFQTPITPSERHLESNQKVQWRPGSWGEVSQRELWVLESGFAETELRYL
jgi:hypothetical protein